MSIVPRTLEYRATHADTMPYADRGSTPLQLTHAGWRGRQHPQDEVPLQALRPRRLVRQITPIYIYIYIYNAYI